MQTKADVSSITQLGLVAPAAPCSTSCMFLHTITMLMVISHSLADMYTCEGTQCSVTIPPPPELGLDLHSDPSIARIAATSLIYANTWSYGVENVLNALESGRWVILVHVGPQDPGFQDTIMFLLKLLTQCPWLKV